MLPGKLQRRWNFREYFWGFFFFFGWRPQSPERLLLPLCSNKEEFGVFVGFFSSQETLARAKPRGNVGGLVQPALENWEFLYPGGGVRVLGEHPWVLGKGGDPTGILCQLWDGREEPIR